MTSKCTTGCPMVPPWCFQIRAPASRRLVILKPPTIRLRPAQELIAVAREQTPATWRRARLVSDRDDDPAERRERHRHQLEVRHGEREADDRQAQRDGCEHVGDG